MGKSRYEALETAIREQAKVSNSNIADKARIQSHEAQLLRIEKELEATIKRIEQSPIDKEALKAKADKDLAMTLQKSENTCQQAKSERAKKLDLYHAETTRQYKHATQVAQDAYEKAKDVAAATRDNNKLLDLEEDRTKEERDIEAQYVHKTTITSINDGEKTRDLQIEKAKADSDLKAEKIKIELDALRLNADIVNEQKAAWQTFYKDIVDISKQQSSE